MASFTGYLETGARLSASPSNPDLGGKDTVGDVDGWAGQALHRHGSLTDTQPVDEPQNAQTGGHAHAFGFLDWFNRIHLEFSVLDMGNLLSTQVVEFTIFSTYFETRTFNGYSATGDDGLALVLPELSTPYPYAPWQERLHELTISVDGPPTIDASYVFDFDNRDYSMAVLGRRVVSWFVPPNWQSPVTERIEFATNVITAYDGTEQRVALRGDAARWFWEFRFDAHGRTARVLENVLYAWGSRIWALPLWPQGEPPTADVAAHDTVVNVPTADLDFHANGLAVLVNIEVPEIYEAIEIESLDATSLTAKRAVVGNWPASSTLVIPVRTCRLTQPPLMTRFTGETLSGAVSFRLEEPLRRTPAVETTYRGFPVLTQRPEWSRDPGADYERKIATLDLGQAPPLVDDESGIPIPIYTQRWTLTTRAATEDFRRWLFARRGKQKAIWTPTFARDLIIKTTVAAAQQNIDVEIAGLKNYAAAGVHRRDLRIETRSGAVYYRRASAYVEVDATTERLTLDAPLGVEYEPDEFALVSWMALARLDSDSTEIAHYTGQVSQSLTALKAPRSTA